MQKAKPGYKLVKSLFGKYEEIPEDWDFRKLDDIGNIVGGGTPESTKDEYWNGEILWAVPSDITEQKSKFIDHTERKISKKGLESSSAKLLSKGALLITTRATIGECSIASKEITTNQGFQNLVCNDENFNEFWYYALQFHKNRLLTLAYGTTFLEISKNWMKQILIPTTKSKKEQKKIASILSNVDDLINKYNDTIQTTKKLKIGLMQTLLTKGIGHKKFKKIKWYFGKEIEIPVEWDMLRIDDFAKVHGRIGWKNLRADEYVDSGPLMLSVWSLTDNIQYGIDYSVGVKRLSKFRYDESPEIKLQNNDVLVAKDGDIGRMGYVKKLPESTTVNSHVVVVRTKTEQIFPEYLYNFMRFHLFQAYCKSYTSGTTVPLLTQKDLKNAFVITPLLQEQQKISSILSSVNEKISELETKKKALESLKKGLLQKLLTGQVRVKI